MPNCAVFFLLEAQSLLPCSGYKESGLRMLDLSFLPRDAERN